MGAAASVENASPSKVKQIHVVSNVAPEGYVIVPNKNAHIIVKQSEQAPIIPALKDNRGESNLSNFSEESKQTKKQHPFQPAHHTPPPHQPAPTPASEAPLLIAAPSEDQIDTIEMGASSKIYWKDLDASAKRSSWKAMEIASVIGKRLTGNTHVVRQKSSTTAPSTPQPPSRVLKTQGK
eukprot:gene29906-36113_t